MVVYGIPKFHGIIEALVRWWVELGLFIPCSTCQIVCSRAGERDTLRCSEWKIVIYIYCTYMGYVRHQNICGVSAELLKMGGVKSQPLILVSSLAYGNCRKKIYY